LTILYCLPHSHLLFFSLFHDTPTTDLYTLSLHDALPISAISYWRYAAIGQYRRTERADGAGYFYWCVAGIGIRRVHGAWPKADRSEEHTSELQSRFDLVCRLLLEKKKIQYIMINHQ